MSRVTSEIIRDYHQAFPLPWRFMDLMENAKSEAVRTGVDFMSLGENELRMVLEALRLAGASAQAAKWIEIGSLTGYSALGFFSVLAKGSHLWTLEKSAERCAFLRSLFNDPRLAGGIEVVEGDSRQSKLLLEAFAPFDGIFIDGAKAEYLNDLMWAEKHLKAGGLILADNIFLSGEVFPATGLPENALQKEGRFSAKQISAMRSFLERLNSPELYDTLVLPTSDGFVLARKRF